MYDLTPKPGRRQGLARISLQSLHQMKPSKPPKEMPSKAPARVARKVAVKNKSVVKREPGVEDEPSNEDIHRPPDGSSSDEGSLSKNIKPTKFKMKKEEQKPTLEPSPAHTREKRATAHGGSERIGKAQKSTASDSPSSSSSQDKSKRGSQDNRPTRDMFTSSALDPFGRVKTKKSKTTYGSSQSRPTSEKTKAAKKAVKLSPVSSPKSKFTIPDEVEDDEPLNSLGSLDSHGSQKLAIPDDFDDSPQKTASSRRKLQVPAEFDDFQDMQKSGTPRGKLNIPDDFGDSPENSPNARKTFRVPAHPDPHHLAGNESGCSFNDEVKVAVSPTSSPMSSPKLFSRPRKALAKRDAKELLKRKGQELGGNLASKVGDMFWDDQDDWDLDPTIDETADVTTTRCPMCGQPCDADQLKKWGHMDTRKQERFCRSHQKFTAESKWSSKGYPEIDWEEFDSRIAEHHDFIKSLLDGGECHYRRTFEDLVAAGKGRSLKKLESNLTPGYYGSRGQSLISGYVLREFQKLLKERSSRDPLMSKRGLPLFVQSVIVPEVAVQLIKEDMVVDDVKAREILAESAKIGELVHEEVKDVVMERVDDDDDGYE